MGENRRLFINRAGVLLDHKEAARACVFQTCARTLSRPVCAQCAKALARGRSTALPLVPPSTSHAHGWQTPKCSLRNKAGRLLETAGQRSPPYGEGCLQSEPASLPTSPPVPNPSAASMTAARCSALTIGQGGCNPCWTGSPGTHAAALEFSIARRISFSVTTRPQPTVTARRMSAISHSLREACRRRATR